ncbi:ABC-2 type transport system permease protein [Clostridium acetobutylicum]|uniref:ABC transporter permease n=1 Tax=Clostridium TaxID=1485 RepID=UPI000200A728|nr:MULTISPECIES: ABC transporter permease [Clostridium]ADZ19919.1 membrane protein [Clostridium acetobutylicum EA 2018]NOV89677.1 ABC-2 type transport system permease protein [Clostridium acetobutylicum]NRY57471.1 ABC-2 type transport system permease protein [Clostridium acetobutylicum]NSA94217.1 ABC-2 type transport system permease protein [Clostridium acetobutylicum]NYC95362.1 ABC-2 type transport system permease protein [Clostridium acetobutylicum]
MNFFVIVLANCRRYLKNFRYTASMIVVPILLTGFVTFFNLGNFGTDADDKIAIVNLDKGRCGSELVKYLKVKDVFNKKDVAIKELKNNNYSGVYEIEKDFTVNINNGRVPKIISYKTDDVSYNEAFENEMKSKISLMVKGTGNEGKSNLILKYREYRGSLLDSTGLTFLIIYCMMLFSMNFSMDLIKLRKDRVLKRLSVTKHKTYIIVWAMYFAMFITQTILYSISFLLSAVMCGYKIQNMGVTVLNIALSSIICIGIVIVGSRILKNDKVASTGSSIVCLLMVYINIVGGNAANSNLSKFRKLTPFYWIMDSVEKAKVFPNSIIVLLIALVLFTAGGFGYNNFSENE